jgi:hypothetical protein
MKRSSLFRISGYMWTRSLAYIAGKHVSGGVRTSGGSPLLIFKNEVNGTYERYVSIRGILKIPGMTKKEFLPTPENS